MLVSLLLLVLLGICRMRTAVLTSTMQSTNVNGCLAGREARAVRVHVARRGLSRHLILHLFCIISIKLFIVLH